MEEAFFIQQLHCNRPFSHDTENRSLSLPRHISVALWLSQHSKSKESQRLRRSYCYKDERSKTRETLDNTWEPEGNTDLNALRKGLSEKKQWRNVIPFSLISLKCELELNLGIFKVSILSNRKYQMPHSALWDARELYCTARELSIEQQWNYSRQELVFWKGFPNCCHCSVFSLSQDTK